MIQETGRPPQKVRFITLGCRVNQYETQGMRELLQQDGYVTTSPAQSSKDRDVQIVVINTCTVTAKADRENRYWVRRARREHPQARIVVTGCGVERDRAAFVSNPQVDLVVSNYDKARISEQLAASCTDPGQQDVGAESPRRRQEFAPLAISQSEGKTRAFIKIQDGCNHACSFCKIVMVRGRSRSRPLQSVIDEVVRLRDAGYRDIVFAGIQLGAYGDDLSSRSRTVRLEDVLEESAKVDGVDRLRFSSIEPTDVRPSLISTMKQLHQCAHHLHIPLQSGDDEILMQMNRRYDGPFYRDLIERLRSELDDFQLTLDVMAGFPGETEDQFMRTLTLLRDVQPLKCHVFPYSRREGTKAARIKDLPSKVIRSRVERLLAEGKQISRAVRRRYIGETADVLIEKQTREGWRHGLTSHFMKVAFRDQGTTEEGQIVPVKLDQLDGDGFLGKINL